MYSPQRHRGHRENNRVQGLGKQKGIGKFTAEDAKDYSNKMDRQKKNSEFRIQESGVRSQESEEGRRGGKGTEGEVRSSVVRDRMDRQKKKSEFRSQKFSGAGQDGRDTQDSSMHSHGGPWGTRI